MHMRPPPVCPTPTEDSQVELLNQKVATLEQELRALYDRFQNITA